MEHLRSFIEPRYKREQTIEEFLISNYFFMKLQVSSLGIDKTNQISLCEHFNEKKYEDIDLEYFSPIINLSRHYLNMDMSKFIEGIVLTNSLVTLDYIKGFSDADCVIFLNDSTYSSIKSLNTTRKNITTLSKYLYLFDPLQHHGFFITSQLDASYYPQANYPLLLFDNS